MGAGTKYTTASFGSLIIEQPKSIMNVADATGFGNFPFFTSGDKILQHISALISGENLYLADGGSAFVQYYNGEASYSNHTYAIKAKEAINCKYLYYVITSLLNTINFRYFQGTGLKNLQKKDFKRHEITFPTDPKEQERIVAILSDIDKAIAETEALIAKYELVKKGLMHDLLTNGIDENGNIRSPQTHVYKDSPLGPIPQEWSIKLLCEDCGTIDPQPDHRTPQEVQNGVPYIGIGDFNHDGEINFAKCRRVGMNVLQKQSKIFTLNNGDIIFGKIGTIGHPQRLNVKVPIALSANIILIQPSETPSFYYWALKSERIERQVELAIHSTSQPAFGMTPIKALVLAVPLKEERLRISAILDSQQEAIESLKLELRKLANQKIALLHDLLNHDKEQR